VRRFINNLLRKALSGKPTFKSTKKRPRTRLEIEGLENRLVPAALSLSNGVLTYTAGTDTANNLSVALSGSTYTFNDTAETIRVAGVTATGNGTNTVSVSSSGVKQIVLTLGNQADTVRIRSAAQPITVNAGDGDDTIAVGSTKNSLADLGANLTVNGQGGNDTLTLNDQGNGAAQTYQILSSSVTRSGIPTIFYGALEGLTLNAGTLGDRIDVRSTLTATPLTINAGGGDDNIIPGQPSAMNGPLTVNGQGGTDTLDYSDFAGIVSYETREASPSTSFVQTSPVTLVMKIHGVTVDLAAGQATELAGMSAIENVRGSAFDDTLLGDDNSNSLWGGDGDDVIHGGDGEDFVSGGAGKDVLLGWDAGHLIDGYDHYEDVFDLAHPVVDGTAFTDVIQAHAPTCTILSSLAAAANQGFDLAGGITYLGNNQYSVRLYRNGQLDPETVYFDGTWNSNDAQPTRERASNGRAAGAMVGEFWTLLYQRAYLQRYITNWENPNPATWNRQGDSGWSINSEPLRVFTGRSDTTGTIAADEPTSTAQAMRDRLAAGDMMIAHHVHHLYAVLGVSKDNAGNWKVTVYNPYAIDDADFDKIDGSEVKNDGLMVLSWTEFAKQFDNAIDAYKTA
jgi:Ca2+-binding RTX toxin-like protein